MPSLFARAFFCLQQILPNWRIFLEFLAEYGMFLAQAVTIVLAFVIVIGVIASAGQRNKKQAEGHIEVINLSEEIDEIRDHMQQALLSEYEYKELHKEKKKAEKAELKEKKKKAKEEAKAKKKQSKLESKSSANKKTVSKDLENKESDGIESTSTESTSTEPAKESIGKDLETVAAESKENQSEENPSDEKGRIFVLDFDGDVEASAVENLREEISAIVSAANEGDKVLLRLESPGGMVHAYGLAASQLTRIKDAELELIIAVDQVAASGGYMMACVADKVLAAPFAVIGSIGVVAEIPNFHRLLKHNKVDYETHTAGEYKRTLTMFSENTDAARKKFKQELEETHDLFKHFITQNRPALEIEKVATGEHWYGTQALELGLIDAIQTSDDYILQAANDNEIFQVTFEVKKPLSQRLSFSVQNAVEKGFMSIWQKSIESRLFKH
jgi:serine protease SohB